MSNASDNFETDFLELLFNNTTIAGIGDTTGIVGSTAAGSLYVRLCTDAVTVDDSTLGTECAYSGYVAKGEAVARTTGGWTVADNEVENTAEVSFGACTAGTETVKYLELWKNNTGATIADRLAWVELSSTLAVSAGVQPKFDAGAITFTFD